MNPLWTISLELINEMVTAMLEDEDSDPERIAQDLRAIADEVSAPEGATIEVPDLDSFEPAGLYDAEIAHVIDSPVLTFALDEDLGRKDPSNGSVWTLVWFRAHGPNNTPEQS